MPVRKFSFQDYLSMFTWRYGSQEMRSLFSEIATRKLWRKIWVALAQVQAEVGLVSQEELNDLKAHVENINITKAHRIEGKKRHDVVAEILTYASQAKKGGGKIHLGATSYDIVDNADILKIITGIKIITRGLISNLRSWESRIKENVGLVCMGYTHIQPAEPTTMGYRFSFYAQELLLDLDFLEWISKNIRAKGMKGAVGTSASYTKLLSGKGMTAEMLDKKVMKHFGLESFPITTQILPRKIDFWVLTAIASIAQSLYKFAYDLRILQSPNFGEMAEPFKKGQVGSSAMAFKRNPISAERICSLAKYIARLPGVAWQNAADSVLERTLDDSANRRIIIPEAFLALDEMLMLNNKIISGLVIRKNRIEKHLNDYAMFLGTEPLMMELSRIGWSVRKTHRIINEELVPQAWEAVFNDRPNPLIDLCLERFGVKTKKGEKKLAIEIIKSCFDPKSHIGDIVPRTKKFAKKLASRLLKYPESELKEAKF